MAGRGAEQRSDAVRHRELRRHTDLFGKLARRGAVDAQHRDADVLRDAERPHGVRGRQQLRSRLQLSAFRRNRAAGQLRYDEFRQHWGSAQPDGQDEELPEDRGDSGVPSWLGPRVGRVGGARQSSR